MAPRRMAGLHETIRGSDDLNCNQLMTTRRSFGISSFSARVQNRWCTSSAHALDRTSCARSHCALQPALIQTPLLYMVAEYVVSFHRGFARGALIAVARGAHCC